jgi:hypothetical protein
MKRTIVFLVLLLLLLGGCSAPGEGRLPGDIKGSPLPRVLFITTGISGDDARMPCGAIIAVQAFNKRGAVVRLEARDILYDAETLGKYNIIILSTFPGYHDADRKYSLSYMSEFELQNLKDFVSQGGVIVSGDNVGRNLLDGTDRIVQYGQLTPANWPLSECYGLGLSEKNMTGYETDGEIEGHATWHTDSTTLRRGYTELWTLVPDSIYSNQVEVLGHWRKGGDSIPAITRNMFGEGLSFLLSSSAYLHPANDGGFWSIDQIEGFYAYVLDEYNRINGINVALNPWPGGHEQAFCVTLNPAGTLEQYRRLFRALENENIAPTVFVNGLVDEEIMDFLRSGKHGLESSGYAYLNYKDKAYPGSLDDILLNENHWDINFKGFRFPYTKPGFWGLMALYEQGYMFESSIGANNMDLIHGSVFPYNIVLSNQGFFVSTDILEIAPTYHDDYYYLKDIHKTSVTDPEEMNRQVMIHSKYLENYWDYSVRPYNGLMVYLGHPRYTAYTDSTMAPLFNLITKVREDDAWITTIGEVAGFRSGLAGLRFYVEEEGDVQYIRVAAEDDEEVKDVCLLLMGAPKKAVARKGTVNIREKAGRSQLVFDASDGQVITVYYQ